MAASESEQSWESALWPMGLHVIYHAIAVVPILDICPGHRNFLITSSSLFQTPSNIEKIER